MQDFSDIDLELMRRRLQDRLWPNRYIHSLGTAEEAVRLAQRWGLREDKAYIAGLLHDHAKSWPEEQLLSLCLLYGISVDRWALDNPDILHGPVAAAMLTDEWDIEDEEIEKAIACHTLPDKDMSAFDMIIYLADKIEPQRKEHLHLEELRRLAYEDLDAAMELSLSSTIEYVEEKGGSIHPNTKEILQIYRNKIKERS